MILGQTVTVEMLVPGGIILLAILAFQILLGKRVIHFKGRRHSQVHRWAAYLMALVALGHGFLGIVLANDWTVL